MPHLQFETTVETTATERRAFADEITELYAEHMETGTGHVAVTIREPATFSLGRLDESDDAVVLNADIRAGRTFEQTRGFVLAAFEAAGERFGVPTAHAYAVITEHDGEAFHEHDRVLAGWDVTEAEEGAD
jgi:phenylpyruvate tautomerase PptA (4-oxalocrotonate tautomerase family)